MSSKTPRLARPHIGIFGKRNVGKSSLINILAGQDVAIVSDTPGTTTDPVKKAMEIPGIGAIVLVDTAGIDDQGILGEARVVKSKEIAAQIDLALLMVCGNAWGEDEDNMLSLFRTYRIPVIVIHNKADIAPATEDFIRKVKGQHPDGFVDFSTQNPHNLPELITLIGQSISRENKGKKSMFEGLLRGGETVMLITPIDSEAPEGRLILPQVQAIREALDNHNIAVVLKETEVKAFLQSTGIVPALVVTDSQLFGEIDKIINDDIPLTGFSVLLARQKGNFEYYLKGTPEINRLRDGDRVLILESCTHHSTCEDIGREKIPRWLQSFTGKNLHFDIIAGLSPITRPVTDYALVIQCGGCMVTTKQLHNRLQPFIEAGIPVTNYGMAIAFTKGIYERATAMF